MELSIKFSLQPIEFVKGNEKKFVSLTANYWENILVLNHAKLTARKINIILAELLDNAIEHNEDKNKDINFEIKIINNTISLSVCNFITEEKYFKLRDYFDGLQDVIQVNDMLIRKLKEDANSGFGLIRLVVENSCRLKIDKINDYVVIVAEFDK